MQVTIAKLEKLQMSPLQLLVLLDTTVLQDLQLQLLVLQELMNLTFYPSVAPIAQPCITAMSLE